MTRFLYAMLVVAAGLSVPPAMARELTEEAFLSSFHAAHPARVVLDERVALARANVRDAERIENPIGLFERQAPGNVGQNTWSLSWKPPFDGRRSARKDAAEAALASALGAHALAGTELRAVLRQAYANWALTSERVAVLEAHADILRELAGWAAQRARLGEASILSARRIAFALTELEAEAARADAERIDAESSALGWMRTPEAGLVPSRPALPAEPVTPDPGQAPTVSVRRQELAAAEAVARASGGFVEFPELELGWQTLSDGSTDIEGPVLGLAWPIPIFNRQQADRDAASAALAASRARLELETARAEAGLGAAARRYERLRVAALAAVDSLAVSDEVLHSAAARYRLGESDVTELVETVRGVLSARLATLDLYGAALASHRELETWLARSWASEDE